MDGWMDVSADHFKGVNQARRRLDHDATEGRTKRCSNLGGDGPKPATHLNSHQRRNRLQNVVGEYAHGVEGPR